MTPKTPKELKDQIERQNENQPADGKDRTAEGLEVDKPTRSDFFKNLDSASRPEKTSE
jgi:hypothetical protein